MAPLSQVGARSVLIVEQRAHLGGGHFSVRFAELAAAYAELGYRVEVLTADGWSASEQELADAPFVVHRFGPVARHLRTNAERLRMFGARREQSSRRSLARQVGHALGLVTLVAAARARRRRMQPQPDVTVVLELGADPVVMAATAGRGRWLLNQFTPAYDVRKRSNGVAVRVLLRVARRAERRRRARGGCFRVAAANAEWAQGWMAWAPFLDPVVLRIAGTRALDRRPDARERLGLAASGRIALCFGSNDSKHPQAVLDAFSTLEGWTLVVAGELVASVDPRAHPDVVLSHNRVSNEQRDLFLSAADLMVLSFPDGYGHNSGTLMDAISVGVPVVCSARSAPAEIVTRYRLGSLFEPDDSASLADAVSRAPAAVDPADLARARADRSNVSVARDQLRAVGLVSLSPASEATTAVSG